MIKPFSIATFCLSAVAVVASATEPRVVATVVVGPFSGHDAARHPDNVSPNPIEYYGTDLGFTYTHLGQLHILFGDSWATEAYAPIQASTGGRFDDGFGIISPGQRVDSSKITRERVPLIRLGQNRGTREMAAIDPDHVMDLGKTPMSGFSNGRNEFAIFNTTKPQGCRTEDDCKPGLACDTRLGYLGTPWSNQAGLTLPCIDGGPGCVADTMPVSEVEPREGSGLCIDTMSTAWSDTDAGRIAAAAIRQLIGRRSQDDARKYPDTRLWLTNKFANVTARVAHLDPQSRADSAGGGDRKPRVLLWGRPGFIGAGTRGRSLGLYFAYAEMPSGPLFKWQVHYYAGDKDGRARFSEHERDAVPLDLDATQDAVQAGEAHDIVNQMSVAWVKPLRRWVLFYGGGISSLPTKALPNCGVLEVFTRSECKDVRVGNGAVRMRTADHPWGPWSPAQDVIVGGDPAQPGSGQYGPGGVLRHPACNEPNCATPSRTPFYQANEYGFFYAVNIIEEWTRSTPDGIEIFWNASTWNPYRVVLLKTRISP